MSDEHGSLTLALIAASFVLAPVVGVIVGSQEPAMARSVSAWCSGVLLLLLISHGALFLATGPPQAPGISGFVIFETALIAALGSGRKFALARAAENGADLAEFCPKPPPRPKPEPWDGDDGEVG